MDTGSHRPAEASAWVGARVRELREQQQWTQSTLAQHCREAGGPGWNWTKLSIHRIETDVTDRPRRPITVDELRVLALALGVEPAQLLPPEAWPGEPPGQKPHRRTKRKDQE
jgi:transcriptional regulator with XRE-family HTH domain